MYHVIQIIFRFSLGITVLRYNCAKFQHCRIYVTDFMEEEFASLHPWAAIKRPILSRVNSHRNKFEQLKELFLKQIDVIVIKETKLDNWFPVSQFLVKDFAKPFRLDQKRNGDGVIIYFWDDISRWYSY